MPWRLALALLAAPAAAQTNCLPLPEMSAFLAQTYGETVNGGGRIGDAFIGIMFTSPAGTWTFVQVDANTGWSCVREYGDGWIPVETVGELM